MVKTRIKCTLADLGEVVGGATPSTKKQEFWDGDIPWLCPKDLTNCTSRYVSRGSRNITKLGFESCSTKLLPAGSILFSSRAPIGYIAIAKNSMCTNQGFKSIVPNENVDSLFMYYLLKHNKSNIENLGSGTTFKEVSASTMRNVEVEVPESLEEQTQIARILSAFDSKIEVNNKLNAKLEELARAVFEERFGGINSNAVLSDFAEVTMGQSPSGSSYNDHQEGAVFYQGRGEFGWRFPKQRLFTSEPKRMAKQSDVLLSVRAPVGDLNVAYEDCCIGRGLAAIHSKKSSFCIYLMKSLSSILDNFNCEGTVFGSINQTSLKALPIGLPSESEIAEFETEIEPIDRLIYNLEKENRSLATLRDTLLPKLMRGELIPNP